MADLRIGIILGTTRPGRVGDQVARWVLEHANDHGGAEFELLDLADYGLPHFDEIVPPSMAQYANAHTLRWAETVDAFDGFVFVTPEYNHAPTGALKDAIDFVYREWNDKAAGIVSYGAAGGVRAAEVLRLILGEVQIADVRQQVAFSLLTDFEHYTRFTPGGHHRAQLDTLLDQVIAWGGALRGVRAAKSEAVAA